MSSASTTLMYAELLSNIRQVSVIASFETPSAHGTKAELSDDRQHLKLVHNGNTVLLTLPVQVAVVPRLQQPKLGGFEISWRLPLASSGLSRRNSVTIAASAPWSANKLSPQAEVSCRKCGNILLTANSIKSWKDLPSENWAEMMDFWHCHKPDIPKEHAINGGSDDHLRRKGYAANNRFAVRKGTGFVDLTYFLLYKDDCRGIELDPDWETSQKLASRQTLYCEGCSTTIGTVDTLSDGYRFYKWSISVSTTTTSQRTSYPLSNFITAHLLSQISFQAVNKFILHCTDSIIVELQPLYIWVFAPYLTVSVSSTSGTAAKPIPASKIFYRSLTASESTAILENASMTTEEVGLPADVMNEVLRNLQESTIRMPKGARKFRDWEVGFLERFADRQDE